MSPLIPTAIIADAHVDWILGIMVLLAKRLPLGSLCDGAEFLPACV